MVKIRSKRIRGILCSILLGLALLMIAEGWWRVRGGGSVFGAVYCWLSALLLIVTAAHHGIRISKSQKDSGINDITAMVSHELKTPLTSMGVIMHNILERKAELSPAAHTLVLNLASEKERLTFFVDRFLAFALLDQGRYLFYFEQTIIGDILDSSIKWAVEKHSSKSIAFDCQLREDDLPIQADKKMLQYALFNLLDNAYVYTNGNTPISLKCFRQENHVVICITDSGIGLSEAEQKMVFEKFYRVDKRLQSETHGCGIGLTFAQHVVAKHKGSINLDSRLGEGSKFTVVLPLQ